MGHKFSAVNGVRSDNFTQPGNAINQIWYGNTEIISRLPFGDNDMEQAGWPQGGMPKIPWHNFIIPMKRDLRASNHTSPIHSNWLSGIPSERLIWCEKCGCISVPQKSITLLRIPMLDTGVLIFAVICVATTYLYLAMPGHAIRCGLMNNPAKIYDRLDARNFLIRAAMSTLFYAFGVWSAVAWWSEGPRLFQFMSWEWKLLEWVVRCILLYRVVTGAWDLVNCWREWWKTYREAIPIHADRLVGSSEDKPHCPGYGRPECEPLTPV
ncbi:uncharacterized protein BDV17DRAFT_93231 [Aspergillus undulatus]|uniref:uncharacterized protein n=1 Tax=Aspergillus undulatus TaxID=1810928 RepID=UPI003CCCF1CE